MNDIFLKIDKIIKKVDSHSNEKFIAQKNKRMRKKIKTFKDNDELLKEMSQIIAYSQRAESILVKKLLQSGKFERSLKNFQITLVIDLNPCIVIDEYWEIIKPIRNQSKIFHIIQLARKIFKLNILEIFNVSKIPKKLKSGLDIDLFWKEFDVLLKKCKEYKLPFFQSTTSLLHFLMEMGYDCIKPDSAVMKSSKNLGIVENEKGEKNLRKTVKTIQEYSVERKIKPNVLDLYLLVDGGQTWAKQLVNDRYY